MTAALQNRNSRPELLFQFSRDFISDYVNPPRESKMASKGVKWHKN